MSNTVLLGEIASLKTGPFGTQLSASEYVKEGIPVINVRNIGYGEIITSDLEYVGEETAKRLYEHLLHKGDIVFGRKGSVDRHAFIDTRYDGWMQGSDCIRVRINEGINPHFISHNLKLESVKKQINSSAVGSTMASLNTDILSRIQIVLPSLEIQNRIEELLSVIEEKIDLNTRLCAKLEAMAKTLYDYWFVQFDFPDENGKPYRTSGGAMEWCQELGRELPKGWRSYKIGELLAPIPNTTRIQMGEYNKEGAVPIIDQSASFIAGYTNDESTLLCSESGYIVFGDHTRIVKYIRFPFARGADGTQIIDSNSPCMPNELFYQVIQSIDLTNQGYARHYKFLKDTTVIVPDEPIAQQYQKVVSPLYDKIPKIVFENVELIKLRDWLLPMLMNGQAYVKVGGDESV